MYNIVQFRLTQSVFLQISVECSNRNVEAVVLGSSCCLLGHLQTLQVLNYELSGRGCVRVTHTLNRIFTGSRRSSCSRQRHRDAFDAGCTFSTTASFEAVAVCDVVYTSSRIC